jgi:chitosanase
MSGTPDLTHAIIEARSQQAMLAKPTNASAAAAATALSNAIAATNAASMPADFDKLLVSLSTLREQAHSRAAEAALAYADEQDPTARKVTASDAAAAQKAAAALQDLLANVTQAIALAAKAPMELVLSSERLFDADRQEDLLPGTDQRGVTAMSELQQETARAIVNVFETGRVRGDYSGIAVIKADTGHLSYGRSQASLGSGALFELLDSYCRQPNAQFAGQLTPYLPRFQQKDVTLDTDGIVRQLLVDAATDLVMRETQDQFFNRRYFAPASSAAEALGINEPLGQTVIYDSHVQGGWTVLKARIAAPMEGKTRDWVKRYIDLRTSWLKSLPPPLPGTVYRMASFTALMDAQNWDLQLPLTVHGVEISEQALVGDTAPIGTLPRTLTLTTPYLRGADVPAVQKALSARDLPASLDGIYGPFTAQLVAQWQKSQGIVEGGVGERTRSSLGLAQ